MSTWIIDFVFLRPWVLWLLIPWAIVTLLQLIKRKNAKIETLIAPHLSRFVLDSEHTQSRTHTSWLMSAFLALAILAASGPSVEKQEVPVFQAKQARVVLVDLSYSMYATDIAPNRLTQMRFKLMDLVKSFKEGDTALVAYAGDAFTISPLTNDAATLENLVPSLSPEIMPSKGANLIAGIEQAISLLEQAKYLQGDIILVTDDVEPEEITTIKGLVANSQYHLSVYAIGTSEGAPIALPDGGFLKDRFGQIVVPKLNVELLQNLVSSEGKFVTYTPTSNDIKRFKPSLREIELNTQSNEKVMWRIDAGVYLLMLLVPMVLFLFRKNALHLSVLLILFAPLEKPQALEVPNWFKNNDQRALDAYQNNNFSQALQADDPLLKGAALYKQGQFKEAADQFSTVDSSEGHYNYGNALAQLGQLDEAISAYERALDKNPALRQAQENKQLLEQLKQQQEQQDQQGEQDPSGDNAQQNEQSEQAQSSDEQGKSQSKERQSEDQQPSKDQQNGEQGQSEQQDQPSSSDSQNTQNNQPDNAANAEQSKEKADSQSAQQASEDPQQKADMTKQTAQEQQDSNNEQMAQNQQPLSQLDARPLTPEEREKAEKIKHLLRKVPDDPAILLRNKMQLEAQKRGQQRYPTGVEKSW
ncbi:TPR domain protein in aerotolerance operon [Pseudoalteromonas luteoviolacea B = ATCC 29581]|nr:TPR domain protein in aerotolerance operon [Pseudoalteromonas luteoviolacea B = ATCC 29581]